MSVATRAETMDAEDAAFRKYRVRVLKKPEMLVSVSAKRYIQTAKKVFQYGSLLAAEIALPRLRRTDHAARIIPEESEYDVLRRTSSTDLILTEDGRKA